MVIITSKTVKHPGDLEVIMFQSLKGISGYYNINL